MADMTPIGPYDRTATNFRDQLDDIFGVQLSRFVTEANAKAAQMSAAATGGGFTIGYVFSTTTTDADPGTGMLRLDNATQNLATTIRADVLDLGSTDWSPVLATFTASSSVVKGQIRLSKMSDGTKWLTFNLTAIATPTGYRNITVTCVGSSAASPFANGDIVMMSFSRTGDKGDQGVPGTDAATAIQYTFDTTTTDADPGAGKLRLSNATQNASTVIRADLLDINGSDMSALLDTFDASTNVVKGQIRLSKLGDSTKFIIFGLTARATPTGYRNLTGSVVASSASNPFANNDTLVLTFARTGDAGTAANGIEIGSVVAMSQTASIVTINGSDYLKTGVLASSGSYPSAPLQNSFSDTTKIIPSGSWSAVAAGGGIAVAIQNGSATGQISYDNGNSWAPITVPSTSYLAITYGGGLFVAVGSSVCATSPDGVNWTSRTIAAQTWQSVIHDGTNFVAVSSGPSTVGTYSADGITWSASTLPSSQNWASLCFGGGLILATPSANVSNVCASSADHGQTWTARTLPQSYNQYAKNCAFGAGLFVVNARDNGGGSTSNTFTSPDCVTWTTRDLGVSVSETKTLTFAGGMFLLTRAGTTSCYTSPDGITWTAKTAAVTHSTIATCVANGGRVIGVQGSGAVVDVYTMAYGRGYHIALFADSQNQGLPLYMRMN